MTVAIVRTNRTRQLPLIDNGTNNLTLEEALQQSIDALNHFGQNYDYWACSFSGGKDSTATATVIAWAILNGLVKAPEKLLILRSDTGQEVPVLDENAELLMQAFRNKGFDARTVRPPVDKRFYVQVLGRGILPVRPGQLGRWCTRALKVDPMKVVLDQIYQENGGQKFLMITGVRLGESAIRDGKLTNSLKAASEIIVPACSKDAGECGSGIWMDKRIATTYDAIPLIVHWRLCHVYDWLQGWVSYDWLPGVQVSSKHGFETYTKAVARMYGQYEDGSLEEDGSRFGCIGCSAIERDRMLERVVSKDASKFPLLELNPMFNVEMRKPCYRLRGGGRRKIKDPRMLGPLTMEARAYFLSKVIDIQERAGIELVTLEDIDRIQRYWKDNTWPHGWTGNEYRGDDWTGLELVDDGQMVIDWEEYS